MNRTNVSTLLLSATILVASIVPTPTLAQLSSNATVFASGLQGPRGLKFGPDGLLYVAESGTGGKSVTTPADCPQVPAPTGPYTSGLTARISRFDSRGNRSTVASGFPSSQNAMGDILGLADVSFLNGTLYTVIAGGGCSHSQTAVPNGVAKVNVTTGSWQIIANLSDFVKLHPTAYPDTADLEPDGVPYSMITVGDRLFVVEANRGQIISTDMSGNMRRDLDVSATQGHVVPTTIAELNNFYYIGNLGTFPIVSNNEHITTFEANVANQGAIPPSPDLYPASFKLGLVGSRAGFTTVVSEAFDSKGILYVLELSPQDGYPTPGTGKLVRVLGDGIIQDVATGLSVPTAMTIAPDGDIYISNLGAAPAGAGQIVRVHLQQ